MWEWFLELDMARGSSGFGPAPISYAEIRAWAALTARCPTPLEVFALKALDRVALKQAAENAAAAGRKRKR